MRIKKIDLGKNFLKTKDCICWREENNKFEERGDFLVKSYLRESKT